MDTKWCVAGNVGYFGRAVSNSTCKLHFPFEVNKVSELILPPIEELT